jgi:PhnB protein
MLIVTHEYKHRRTAMSMSLAPYLNFRGNAREAMEFYQQVLGGELTASSFADFGMPVGPGEDALIMHSQLITSAGFTLMGSDVPSHMEFETGTNNFSVSLSGDDDEQLTGYWEKLSHGATIMTPLDTAPWGDSFGMLTDKFGVAWIVNISMPTT